MARRFPAWSRTVPAAIVVGSLLLAPTAVASATVTSSSQSPASISSSTSGRPNVGKYLLAESDIANVVHPDEELTLVYGPQYAKKFTGVGYSYLSVDVPKTAIVKIRLYRKTFATFVRQYAKKGKYNVIRSTKKYWSGYSVSRDGIYYAHLNNVGGKIVAEGVLIIPLDSDDLDKSTAIITTRNLTLAQEDKLNKAGYGTAR